MPIYEIPETKIFPVSIPFVIGFEKINPKLMVTRFNLQCTNVVQSVRLPKVIISRPTCTNSVKLNPKFIPSLLQLEALLGFQIYSNVQTRIFNEIAYYDRYAIFRELGKLLS